MRVSHELCAVYAPKYGVTIAKSLAIVALLDLLDYLDLLYYEALSIINAEKIIVG